MHDSERDRGPANDTPFAGLTPEIVIAAVEAAGHPCDGRVLALNSYENRVYQVGREDDEPVVVKFYRPRRWSDAAILEEHAFALELEAAEIPVVAPLRTAARSLLEYSTFRYALYPRRNGYWPELATSDDRIWMGRFLGRVHALGQAQRFQHRPTLSLAVYGSDARQAVLESGFLPDYLVDRYAETTAQLIEQIGHSGLESNRPAWHRIHGDCHRGNILWRPEGPHIVDLDDCMTGPAIQDLWMLLAGNRDELRAQAADLIEGYAQFANFNRAELALIEPLRTLRLIHYAAWLARRWNDPAFPRAFPWFSEPRYWESHVSTLQSQVEALDEEPLTL
ncbi:MAG TPA: serine/threonine protein kinase [Steroidobacteraceae bacterium]|nr:serine/threonine protein kinase [Steroidobacteraceae bacterium]